MMGSNWLVVMTKPRMENEAKEHLIRQDIEAYLPLWKELKKKEREQLAAQQAAQEHRSRRAIPVVEPPSRPGATSRRPGQGQGGGRSLRR